MRPADVRLPADSGKRVAALSASLIRWHASFVGWKQNAAPWWKGRMKREEPNYGKPPKLT
jgi:hypothetical protein